MSEPNLASVERLPGCSSAVTMWKTAHLPPDGSSAGGVEELPVRVKDRLPSSDFCRTKVCGLTSKDNGLPPRAEAGGSALPLWAHAPVKIHLQPSQINTSPPCPNKRDCKAALSFCKAPRLTMLCKSSSDSAVLTCLKSNLLTLVHVVNLPFKKDELQR